MTENPKVKAAGNSTKHGALLRMGPFVAVHGDTRGAGPALQVLVTVQQGLVAAVSIKEDTFGDTVCARHFPSCYTNSNFILTEALSAR